MLGSAEQFEVSFKGKMIVFEKKFQVEEEKVLKFLDLTKDFNPAHRKERITPGMYLIASLSDLLGYITQDKNTYLRECEYTFTKPSLFPCEVKQEVYITHDANGEISLDVYVQKDVEVIMKGKIKYSRELIHQSADEEKKDVEIVRKEKISSEMLKEFYESIKTTENEAAMKNFLLSFVPGALVDSFLKTEKGIYVKQQASFYMVGLDSILTKEISIGIKRINQKRISKFRTLGTLGRCIAFDGYALAGQE
ncbi:hypothetical protein HZA33_04105 [Candidatus Pacearchaeota archaeon]|nr:hypothetical protein [Candidatus Pacearchaeota archaeon]